MSQSLLRFYGHLAENSNHEPQKEGMIDSIELSLH